MTVRRWRVLLLGLAWAVASGGCTYLAKQDAESTENLLAAAGFTMKPADTPEKLSHLQGMPARKIVTRTKGNQLVFTYADPEFCKCLWVGNARQYNEYQRLSAQRQVAQMQLMASEEAEMASMRWGMWGAGPWGPW